MARKSIYDQPQEFWGHPMNPGQPGVLFNDPWMRTKASFVLAGPITRVREWNGTVRSYSYQVTDIRGETLNAESHLGGFTAAGSPGHLHTVDVTKRRAQRVLDELYAQLLALEAVGLDPDEDDPLWAAARAYRYVLQEKAR